MATRRSDLHHRPAARTTAQAVAWLEGWSSERWEPNLLPQRPWRRLSPRELESVAEALLKARAVFDARNRRV